jgi:Pyruvate/2-oxoacid:ferredoxin oxidoreductase gamma subunit
MQGMALVGVFLRVAPFVAAAGISREALFASVGRQLVRFFGKRGQSVIEANLTLVREAYDNLIDVGAAIRRGTQPGGTR